MQPTLTGDVVAPHDPGYAAARQDFNRRFDRHPRYVVFCRSVEDVQAAVRWSRQHCLPLRARSGRHSYEAYSVLDGGVVVDVSPLNAVVRSGDMASVGAGATLGQVYDALWAAGQVPIPGGGCTGVGIAGLTLGGGFGFLARLLGLTCDSLIGLEMVDARGRLVRAAPDLLWASRGGGGGNFGVVTRLEFRVHPVDYVTVYSVAWPFSALRAVLAAWEAWADPVALDRRLTPILVLAPGGVTALGEFVGPQAELERLIAPLLAAAPPSAVRVAYETYIEAVHRFVGEWAYEPALSRFKNTSAYQMEAFPPSAVDTMVRWLERAPSPNTAIQLNLHGGAESGFAGAAYPWRAARCSLQYQAYWQDPADGPAAVGWVNGLRGAMLPWTRGAYVNYIDADIADWPDAYYAGSLRRLLQVKRRYDPDDVFAFPQGLSSARQGPGYRPSGAAPRPSGSTPRRP
jgi:FAD/FMN-containing dehydrogenase